MCFEAPGRALRTNSENLLAADVDAKLVVDFSGLRVVASSFADEFLGKLRLDMSKEEFARRVVFTGYHEDVATIVAGAVAQRVRSG